MQGSLLERPSAITASAKDPTKIPLDTVSASCTKANMHGERRKLRSWVGEETQKITQFDAKWCTFWASLYLKTINRPIHLEKSRTTKPSRNLEEEKTTINVNRKPHKGTS